MFLCFTYHCISPIRHRSKTIAIKTAAKGIGGEVGGRRITLSRYCVNYSLIAKVNLNEISYVYGSNLHTITEKICFCCFPSFSKLTVTLTRDHSWDYPKTGLEDHFLDSSKRGVDIVILLFITWQDDVIPVPEVPGV